MKDHSDERQSWWETILMIILMRPPSPRWKTTLMKDNPDERPLWWSYWWDHPQRPSWWEHPDERPLWWKKILMRDQPSFNLARVCVCVCVCVCVRACMHTCVCACVCGWVGVYNCFLCKISVNPLPQTSPLLLIIRAVFKEGFHSTTGQQWMLLGIEVIHFEQKMKKRSLDKHHKPESRRPLTYQVQN